MRRITEVSLAVLVSNLFCVEQTVAWQSLTSLTKVKTTALSAVESKRCRSELESAFKIRESRYQAAGDLFGQVVHVTAQLALAKFVISLLGEAPAAVIGHSLGELTAAAVASAYSTAEIVRLVEQRALAFAQLSSAPDDAMVAVFCSANQALATILAMGLEEEV